MASYIELLLDDSERVRKALQGLMEEQEARLRQLTTALQEYSDTLDRNILRTLIFRTTFGAGQQETMTAETETGEASKPVTEVTRQIQRQTMILDAYREALQKVEAGGKLEEAGAAALPEIQVP